MSSLPPQSPNYYTTLLLEKDAEIACLKKQLTLYQQTFGRLSMDNQQHKTVVVVEDPSSPLETMTNSIHGDDIHCKISNQVSLEYVQDSPMSRDSMKRMEESLSGLNGFLMDVLMQIKKFIVAGKEFGHVGRATAMVFDQQTTKLYSRALFTSSYPSMGELSTVLMQFQTTLISIQDDRDVLLRQLEQGLFQPLRVFLKVELPEMIKLRKNVDRYLDEYEELCSHQMALNKEEEVDIEALGRTRRHYELARFDLVEYLNRLDARKKFVLIQAMNSTLNAYQDHHRRGLAALERLDTSLQIRQKDVLNQAWFEFKHETMLWEGQRKHLEKELNGYLVPHVKALNSIHSIRIISPETDASRTNHSNIIRKQGYLYIQPPPPRTSSSSKSTPSIFSTLSKQLNSSSNTSKQRWSLNSMMYNSRPPSKSTMTHGSTSPWDYPHWFQIHSGKLYQYEKNTNNTADGVSSGQFKYICSLLLATVRKSILHHKHTFEIIDATTNQTLRLRAMNASEMDSWITAARKSTQELLLVHSYPVSQINSEEETCEYVYKQLMEMNPTCVDCTASTPEWISINIGALLCIECCGIHRSLGTHISKVNSLTLDSIPKHVLHLVQDHLGNARVNRVWEHTIPDGWKKPGPKACRQVKEKWIRSKYSFSGFSSEEEEEDVLKKWFVAAQKNSIQDMMWCLAHRVDINAQSTALNGNTALHFSALSNHVLGCEYLVLNGAALGAINDVGKTAAEVTTDAELQRRLLA